ncbi:DUF4956 domain-containing protein [Acetivibrio cellulolyticus]|uniref:DUF4956 domain-containing protein n=1 Tax=Acetivibrio cellulolyticus TaxID=35830 RepID=UPI0001E2D919|nr:DUF4956 domain-containing protein [Acetivibrio cellulolyticus]
MRSEVTNNQVNFNDIFKSNFLEKVSSFSALDTLIALGLAFALGLFIYFVYKKTFKGVMYSKSFSISLVALTMITTLLILAVTSNVVLSLGMVGALSIIRFRSAIKDPMDIAYLFWAIATGIVLGAGLIPLAVFGAVFIGIILVIFVNKSNTDNPYVLIVNCEDDKAESNVLKLVQDNVKKYVVKSKTVTGGKGIEITVEIRLKSMETTFVNEISRQNGVSSAVMVSYNGDYMS